VSTVAIPNRPVFRAQEVCEIAQLQPYVLRSWEAEFPELGVSKSPSSPKVYRKADVELVLRIKHMLFVDGLTLAGARKQLTGEGSAPSDEIVTDADVAAMIDDTTRQHLRDVKRGLQWILGVLSGKGITPEDRVLHAAPARAMATSRHASPAKRSPAPKAAAKKKRK
jgi:DNA-binding transcriptional MerR regulator